MDQSIGECILDPRRGTDRIQALLHSFTAPTNTCPFHDKKVRSTCALDPSSRRAWNCHGISFIEGFCCDRIIDKSAEIDELIKFLQIFSFRKKQH